MIFDELWRQQRACRKSEKFYKKAIQKLLKAGKQKEAQEMEEEASFIVGDCHRDLGFAVTRAIVKEAQYLRVPLPEYSDKESWDNFYGYWTLNPKAYDDLRKRIRQERKERREIWISWVKDVIAPLGGIAISIISLLIAYAALNIRR
jgi:histidinol phosphatase-like enzyme